jgi:hypothetical protein
MLVIGFLFAFATLLAAFISFAMRGAATVGEMIAWIVVAASFALAGALAPDRR